MTRRPRPRALGRVAEAVERIEDPDFAAFAEQIGARVAEERARKGLPIRFIAPRDGTGWEIGGLSLVQGGPNRTGALRLVDWALDPENQKLGPQNGEVSIQSNSKTPVDKDVPRFEDAKTIAYDFAKYGTPAVRDGLIKRWTEQVFPIPR